MKKKILEKTFLLNYIKHFLKDVHWPLFILVIVITLAGIVFIYTASYSATDHLGGYAYKQFIWFLIGMIGLIRSVNIS